VSITSCDVHRGAIHTGTREETVKDGKDDHASCILYGQHERMTMPMPTVENVRRLNTPNLGAKMLGIVQVSFAQKYYLHSR
jgi:hypothetical protein